MEAIGEQRTEFGVTAGVLPLTPGAGGPPARRRNGWRPEAHDAGTSRTLPACLHAPAGSAPADLAGTPGPAGAGPVDLPGVLGLLTAFAAAAPEIMESASYGEAAQAAGYIEEISRSVEYLQVLAAGAVDRTRTQAIAGADAARARAARTARMDRMAQTARVWATGWNRDGVEILDETDTGWPGTASGLGTGAMSGAVVTSPADDGCRTTAEFLRLRLRIPIREASRRLSLASQTLPGTTLTGQPILPVREHLATAFSPAGDNSTADPDPGGPADSAEPAAPAPPARWTAPTVSSYAATIIAATLDRLQHHTSTESLNRVEHHLTVTAATSDPDFLARVARRWADTINADGAEPTEEALRHTQGAFIRKPRHGLHHVEIFATPVQYEHLATAMNAATNPRTTCTAGSTAGASAPGHQDTPDLDRRTRGQRQLDGILSALTAGLTTNLLPVTGGHRPQIIATINYRDLFPQPGTTASAGTGISTGTHDANTGSLEAATGTPEPDPGPGTAAGTPAPAGHDGTGTFVFGGPVAAATLRTLACDADIIPALLGTRGEILDLGRKTRLFTAAQRLALTARDQGCAFPNCTAPVPWCEAHHITYWSQGGGTSTSNGVLLCNHHHHLVHKEQWTITTVHGTPAFIPPAHIDPDQKPQQNHYFKPPPLPHQRE